MESQEKLKRLKVERDLVVAKLQRRELQGAPPTVEGSLAQSLGEGAGEDGTKADAQTPTSLQRLQLDRQTLADLGLSGETVATLYRTLYVFTVGFHEHASNVMDGASGNHELVSRMWRSYSLMAEELSGQSVETELEQAMHALLEQNYELRENAVEAHQQLLSRDGEVNDLAQEVRIHLHSLAILTHSLTPIRHGPFLSIVTALWLMVGCRGFACRFVI